MSLPGERLLQVRILIDPTLRSQAELGYEEREVLRFLAALHAEARLAQEARGASLRLVMFVEPRHELGQDALLSRVEAVARDSSVIACVQRARSNSIEGEVNAFRKTLEVLERVEREHPRDRVMVVRVSRNLQLALSGVVAQGLRRRGFSALTLLAPFA
ncbi:MAG TPA: hypothetical protein DEA08_37745 [Planctomycetes bacterium]|nr:hypothetical protein [Planctomycetota bacterium]|tara:strand:+ start:983 stop:1459 length:477 start_codon:yes stop_codon:yes gene_type:complete